MASWIRTRKLDVQKKSTCVWHGQRRMFSSTRMSGGSQRIPTCCLDNTTLASQKGNHTNNLHCSINPTHVPKAIWESKGSATTLLSPQWYAARATASTTRRYCEQPNAICRFYPNPHHLTACGGGEVRSQKMILPES